MNDLIDLMSANIKELAEKRDRAWNTYMSSDIEMQRIIEYRDRLYAIQEEATNIASERMQGVTSNA